MDDEIEPLGAPPGDETGAPAAAGGEPPPEPPPLELWRTVGDLRPWGTMLVLLAWAGVFAWQAARRELGDPAAELARGANVVSHDALDVAGRSLASTFLHASAGHVFFNAVALLVLGQAVEWVFARAAFWIVYAAGGAAASVASVAWHAGRPGAGGYLSVGGSGAVCAVGAALLPGAWRLRHQLAVGRARALAAVVLLLTLPSIAAGAQQHGTDNVAHAAGFATGLALGALVPLSPRLGGRPGALTRGAGVLGALALLAALLRVLAG